MKFTRREYLASSLAVPVAAGIAPSAAATTAPLLPDKASFAATPLAYLDNAATHPISLGARAAVEDYLATRALDPRAKAGRVAPADVIARFARLTNADPDEISWVQSTTTGEQMILRALGFPERGGRIVTDTLHFYASFPMYRELTKQGVDVQWVRARGNRVELEDLARAITPGTKLVCVSLASTVNGFHHDLKAVCDLAHAAGALVYADIIHAAGAIPVDLHGSGVDFAASATYKWLMGDFGLGFLYVRRDILPTLPRTNYGYNAFTMPQTHVYPLDPPGAEVVDYAVQPGTLGAFGLGSYSHAVLAQLDYSLDYIQRLGVPAIQAHARTLTDVLKEELPKRGYRLMTPLDAPTPIVSCVLANAKDQLADSLAKAKVRIALYANRFRVSPSVFNDMADVERLLAALPRA